MLYRKKPETVHAIRFTPSHEQVGKIIALFNTGVAVHKDELWLFHGSGEDKQVVHVAAGSWIVQHEDGMFEAVSHKKFQELYERED